MQEHFLCYAEATDAASRAAFKMWRMYFVKKKTEYTLVVSEH